MNKVTTAKEALSHIKDNDVVLIGGFLQGGSPEYLLAETADLDVKGLTIVSNDTGRDDLNTAKVLQAKPGRVTKCIATYIGFNSTTQKMLMDDPKSVELNPQGTLAERIRAAGAGIPAFYTPTGVGTVVAEGKEVRIFNGKEYLMETALYGDVAIIRANKVDEFGNCVMLGTTKNFNALMPAAAKYTVVETDEIVPVGSISPEDITVSGIYVNAIVKKEG